MNQFDVTPPHPPSWRFRLAGKLVGLVEKTLLTGKHGRWMTCYMVEMCQGHGVYTAIVDNSALPNNEIIGLGHELVKRDMQKRFEAGHAGLHGVLRDLMEQHLKKPSEDEEVPQEVPERVPGSWRVH